MNYRKISKLNSVGREGLTTTVSIPYEIIKKAAKSNNMSNKDFVKTHHAIVTCNVFGSILIRLERIQSVTPSLQTENQTEMQTEITQ